LSASIPLPEVFHLPKKQDEGQMIPSDKPPSELKFGLHSRQDGGNQTLFYN